MTKKKDEVPQEEVKKAKVTEVQPTDVRKEPKPGSRKAIYFNAGHTEDGASIKALAEETGTTTSNVRQHITQCHKNLGYGYRIEGDQYWITGETTDSWDDQQAAKAEAKKAAAPEEAAPEETNSEGATPDETADLELA